MFRSRWNAMFIRILRSSITRWCCCRVLVKVKQDSKQKARVRENSGFNAKIWNNRPDLWINFVKHLDTNKKEEYNTSKGFLLIQNPTGYLWSKELQDCLLMWYYNITEAFENSEYHQMSLWTIIAHLVFECKAFVDFCCIARPCFFHAMNPGQPRGMALEPRQLHNTYPEDCQLRRSRYKVIDRASRTAWTVHFAQRTLQYASRRCNGVSTIITLRVAGRISALPDGDR